MDGEIGVQRPGEGAQAQCGAAGAGKQIEFFRPGAWLQQNRRAGIATAMGFDEQGHFGRGRGIEGGCPRYRDAGGRFEAQRQFQGGHRIAAEVEKRVVGRHVVEMQHVLEAGFYDAVACAVYGVCRDIWPRGAGGFVRHACCSHVHCVPVALRNR
jgi:hypothetical protein